MNTVTIKIENLKCNGCANTITEGIKKFDEVESVTVKLDSSTVDIQFSGSDTDITKYRQKLEQLGYPESGHNSTISVVKSFVSCAKGRIHG